MGILIIVNVIVFLLELFEYFFFSFFFPQMKIPCAIVRKIQYFPKLCYKDFTACQFYINEEIRYILIIKSIMFSVCIMLPSLLYNFSSANYMKLFTLETFEKKKKKKKKKVPALIPLL